MNSIPIIDRNPGPYSLTVCEYKNARKRKKERRKKKSRVYRTAKLVLSKDMSIGNVVEYVRVYVMVEYMFGGVCDILFNVSIRVGGMSLLLLLFAQTYSMCHVNGFIYLDILTSMCVIYKSWCGGEW